MQRTLKQAKLRVVKRIPEGLVLTNGTALYLYVPAEAGFVKPVVVEGLAYRFERRVRGREL